MRWFVSCPVISFFQPITNRYFARLYYEMLVLRFGIGIGFCWKHSNSWKNVVHVHLRYILNHNVHLEKGDSVSWILVQFELWLPISKKAETSSEDTYSIQKINFSHTSLFFFSFNVIDRIELLVSVPLLIKNEFSHKNNYSNNCL